MKKLLFALVILSLARPFVASADSYDGPYCFEEKNSDYAMDPDLKGIRGTCRRVDITTIVTLDPRLQNDYLIGTHEPIGFWCDRSGCAEYAKYSEKLAIQTSSTVILESEEPNDVPRSVALFGKPFFMQKFKEMGSDIPPVRVYVYEKGEFEKIKEEPGYVPGLVFDKIQTGYYGWTSLTTLSNVEYGKHILGPKTITIESQYSEIFENKKAKTSPQLGISFVESKARIPVVSLTNPLKKVIGHWTYAPKNGKPALLWMKTEYHMDDGSVNVIGPDPDGMPDPVPPAESPTVQPDSPKPEPIKVGFWRRIWNSILSWFR